MQVKINSLNSLNLANDKFQVTMSLENLGLKENNQYKQHNNRKKSDTISKSHYNNTQFYWSTNILKSYVQQLSWLVTADTNSHISTHKSTCATHNSKGYITPLVVITETTTPVPCLQKSSLCNSFEDQAPVDGIYRRLIFKWVAVTWRNDRVPG